jgi:hypothetical protein
MINKLRKIVLESTSNALVDSVSVDIMSHLEHQMKLQIQAEEDARIMRALNNICKHSRDIRYCEDPECQAAFVHGS